MANMGARTDFRPNMGAETWGRPRPGTIGGREAEGRRGGENRPPEAGGSSLPKAGRSWPNAGGNFNWARGPKLSINILFALKIHHSR